MIREILTIGDKVDIKPLDKNGRPLHNTRVFASQLIDFVDFDQINITAPIVYGRAIPLAPGENYNLCFYTNKGLYQCNCIALGNHKENNMIVTVVRIVTNLEKFQRRQFYRLECILDIDYRLIRKEEDILQEKLQNNEFSSIQEKENCIKLLDKFNNEWIKSTITNISGGGARFNSNKQLLHGDKYKIRVIIPKGHSSIELELNAIIINSEKLLNRSEAYENRVQFHDVNSKDREELIRYIFELDRKRRRNEKN